MLAVSEGRSIYDVDPFSSLVEVRLGRQLVHAAAGPSAGLNGTVMLDAENPTRSQLRIFALGGGMLSGFRFETWRVRKAHAREYWIAGALKLAGTTRVSLLHLLGPQTDRLDADGTTRSRVVLSVNVPAEGLLLKFDLQLTRRNDLECPAHGLDRRLCASRA
jgi:hypothetical protein